jgi:trafficking protein particle complex subunit 11
MDEYPPGTLDHNVPLLFLSGLSSGPAEASDPIWKERGILIRSELAPLESRESRSILDYIQRIDASNLSWNAKDSSRKYKFRVKTIGRVSKELGEEAQIRKCSQSSL